jgi:hypothetical protein
LSPRTRAAATSKLERTLSDLINRGYALTPAEIELLRKPAPPRMLFPPPSGFSPQITNRPDQCGQAGERRVSVLLHQHAECALMVGQLRPKPDILWQNPETGLPR